MTWTSKRFMHNSLFGWVIHWSPVDPLKNVIQNFDVFVLLAGLMFGQTIALSMIWDAVRLTWCYSIAVYLIQIFSFNSNKTDDPSKDNKPFTSIKFLEYVLHLPWFSRCNIVARRSLSHLAVLFWHQAFFFCFYYIILHHRRKCHFNSPDERGTATVIEAC